jgi:TPR repeat protein
MAAEDCVQADGTQAFEQGAAYFCKGNVGSYPRATGLFRAAANVGHAVATIWLARCYWRGEGVEKNQAEGKRLARLALDKRGLQALADRGDASAQHALGEMYSCKLEYREAAAWWRKAAAQGHPQAKCGLAKAYRDGDGVEQDIREAVVLWLQAAEQGDTDAQCCLGYAYRQGEGGCDQDDCKAVEWFQKAADQGDAAGQCCVGYALRDGDGVDQPDHRKAVEWFRKSAEQGDTDGQTALGTAYWEGLGVDVDERQSTARTGFDWWRKAAEQGDAEAQGCLGDAYRDGKTTSDWTLRQDHQEAMAWWAKAAKQGDGYAQCALGFAYREGRGASAQLPGGFAVPRDECRAVQCFRDAVEQDSEEALRTLREWDTALHQVNKSQLKAGHFRNVSCPCSSSFLSFFFRSHRSGRSSTTQTRVLRWWMRMQEESGNGGVACSVRLRLTKANHQAPTGSFGGCHRGCCAAS